MKHKRLKLADREIDGYEIPLGQVNLVCIVTNKGMLGCSAFNVIALDKFGYPACCISSKQGKPISTVDDLLDGIVKEVNVSAKSLGINIGMPAIEVLNRI
jgi:uncharacterized protein YunC (DUF1805 family)